MPRGGPRDGAGRKPRESGPWAKYDIKLPPDLRAEVAARGPQWVRAVIESAIANDRLKSYSDPMETPADLADP